MTPEQKNEAVVYALSKASRCYSCDQRLLSNEIAKLNEKKDEREVLCRQCAGLGDFVVLPRGNASLTRLAKKYSTLHYVIVKWSETWKCYERQGLLVEKQAFERAQKEASLR